MLNSKDKPMFEELKNINKNPYINGHITHVTICPNYDILLGTCEFETTYLYLLDGKTLQILDSSSASDATYGAWLLCSGDIRVDSIKDDTVSFTRVHNGDISLGFFLLKNPRVNISDVESTKWNKEFEAFESVEKANVQSLFGRDQILGNFLRKLQPGFVLACSKHDIKLLDISEFRKNYYEQFKNSPGELLPQHSVFKGKIEVSSGLEKEQKNNESIRKRL